jgi:hypothetical protein
MRMSLRQKRLREQRTAFLFFVTFALVYLVAGLPIAAGTIGSDAHAGRALLPPFAELDRNHDGYVDSSETAGLEALASTFARADANGDGRLDRREFAQARATLERRP